MHWSVFSDIILQFLQICVYIVTTTAMEIWKIPSFSLLANQYSNISSSCHAIVKLNTMIKSQMTYKIGLHPQFLANGK